MDKYLLYDPEDGYETFETIESLKNHVNNLDFPEGFPEESFKIYVLEEVSRFKEIDNIDNYKCIKDILKNCICKDSCEDAEDKECEDAEEWRYGIETKRIGMLEWIKNDKIFDENRE